MSVLSNWLKCLTRNQILRRLQTLNNRCDRVRTYAEIPKSDVTSKQIMVTGIGSENEERVRVRRARPGDTPRVLRFVREHARLAWPGLAAPPAQPQVMLCDYVARALAQGHSMLAEQQEPRRGWSQIRGLALGGSVCPWDASSLERWAKCVRCVRSRRLMHFTAHCLRAPALHDKYKVHKVMQVILIVPPDNPKSTEIVNILAKNAIKRGKEVGFPLVRFDVTSDNIAKSLESINLKKEWQLTYDILPEILRDQDAILDQNSLPSGKTSTYKSKNAPVDKSFIAVYSIKTTDSNNKYTKLNKKKMI